MEVIMRKIVFAALAILGLALGIAAPAYAAVPWQQQGTTGGGDSSG
jgi:hypothetical protein